VAYPPLLPAGGGAGARRDPEGERPLGVQLTVLVHTGPVVFSRSLS
jgi:hypothetical protein